MHELMSELMESWETGAQVAVGTLVSSQGSAPRAPGSSMVVRPDGTVAGSVSGGCVEGAVFDAATKTIVSGVPALHRFGFSDDDAFAVGLTCGGIVDIFVEAVSQQTFPDLELLADAIATEHPIATATVIEHPSSGRLGNRAIVTPQSPALTGFLDPLLDQHVHADVATLLAEGISTTLTYDVPDGASSRRATVFVESFRPRPRMLVFGAIDFAAAVAKVGSFLGYRVTVCDARSTFVSRDRFPDADDVVVDWPHRYLAGERDAGRLGADTVIIVLTHDLKFDLPALEIALRLPEVGFVGALGSRQTTLARDAALRERGLTEDELARLSSPVGLDLGGNSPAETAMSIGAEIVARRHGGSGAPLSSLNGRIHRSAGMERSRSATEDGPVRIARG